MEQSDILQSGYPTNHNIQTERRSQFDKIRVWTKWIKAYFARHPTGMTPEGQNGAKRHFAIWLPNQQQYPNRTSKSVRQNTRMNEVNKSVFWAASLGDDARRAKWSEATFCYLATPLTTISKQNVEVSSTKYAVNEGDRKKLLWLKKFERDRVQAGTRRGEYWRYLPLWVTNRHAGRSQIFENEFFEVAYKNKLYYLVVRGILLWENFVFFG